MYLLKYYSSYRMKTTQNWLSTFRDTRTKSMNSSTEFNWILWVRKARSTGECWEHSRMILNHSIWLAVRMKNWVPAEYVWNWLKKLYFHISIDMEVQMYHFFFFSQNTGLPQRYRGFGSRRSQYSECCNKASHKNLLVSQLYIKTVYTIL